MLFHSKRQSLSYQKNVSSFTLCLKRFFFEHVPSGCEQIVQQCWHKQTKGCWLWAEMRKSNMNFLFFTFVNWVSWSLNGWNKVFSSLSYEFWAFEGLKFATYLKTNRLNSWNFHYNNLKLSKERLVQSAFHYWTIQLKRAPLRFILWNKSTIFQDTKSKNSVVWRKKEKQVTNLAKKHSSLQPFRQETF